MEKVEEVFEWSFTTDEGEFIRVILMLWFPFVFALLFRLVLLVFNTLTQAMQVDAEWCTGNFPRTRHFPPRTRHFPPTLDNWYWQ